MHVGMVPLACPGKGKGFSLSLEVFTFTLLGGWLSQQMGTHAQFWFCINIWRWGQQDSHLQQPWLMYSCQGMEMFQPQPCSALAALVEFTYFPPFPPKIMLYPDSLNF